MSPSRSPRGGRARRARGRRRRAAAAPRPTVSCVSAIARIVAEDRPDAGRPAERESEAHEIGAPHATRLVDFETLLAKHRADAQDAEKMRPIRMMPSPAAIDSGWLHCRSSAPKADAVAPSATKTVVNPATNSTSATRMSRRALLSLSSASASTRRSGEKAQIRRRRAAGRRAERRTTGPRRARRERKRRSWPSLGGLGRRSNHLARSRSAAPFVRRSSARRGRAVRL